MTAEQKLKDGDLGGALVALQDEIRKAPGDARLRIFLFQLLCVTGDRQRAIQQLKTAATLDPGATAMAQTYRSTIICETYREQVFSGAKMPLVFGEPEDWIALMIEALGLEARGEHRAAEDLRAQAFEAAPSQSGQLNGTPFQWIADADPRLGPLLEIIVNGRYFWAPFTALHQLRLEAPSDLRDRVWMPATVTWANGGDAVAFIPTRYAGSHQSADDALRLARATDWLTRGDAVTGGIGQRLLATDSGDCALMDLRALEIGALTFETADAAGTDHV